MAEPQEGQIGTAPDGTLVVFTNGRAVPVGGPEFPGFQPQGNGIYRDREGGTFQINRQGQLIRRGGTAGGDSSESRSSRKDFEGLEPVKAFRETRAAFETIQSAAQDGTGASDMTMVMALNKALDPGSVVREGEYDRALQIGGLSDRLAGYMSKLQNGEFLTPKVRDELLRAAQSLYEVRRDEYNDLARRYQGIAREDGLPNPLSVAREEFRGQRITANPRTQEMGQANEAQVKARPEDYDPQAPLGSPQRPFVLSPGVSLDNLPEGASYIDMDGKLVAGGNAGLGSSRETAVDYTSIRPDELVALVGKGGWIRNGPDGEPYQVNPGDVRPDAPRPGDRQVQPGLLERARERNEDVEGMSAEESVAELRKAPGWQRQLDAGARGFVDAATLGFSDELGAGIDAVIGYGEGDNMGERYKNRLDVYRGIADADNQDAVAGRRIGQLGGLVAGGGAAAGAVRSAVGRVAPRAAAALELAPAVQGASRGQNIVRQGQNALRVAAQTAPASALAGAGYTEEGGNRAENALLAGGAGAVAGPAVSRAANAFVPVVTRGVQSAGRFLGRQVGNALDSAGIPGGAALAERAAPPNALASGAELLARKNPIDADALQTEAAKFRANGIEPTFFDIAGDGTQATGRALATRQTPGRQRAVDFGRERRVGAQDRVSEIARRNVSDDPRTATQYADDLASEQQTLSAAAMNPIRGESVALTPETAAVFRTPGGRQAIEQARKWAGNSQQGEELAALSRLADDALDNPGEIQLSLGTLDRLRRSLRNQGLTARRAGDGDAVQGIGGLERSVRGDATTAVPEYGKFLKDYADRADLEDAVDFGGQYLGRSGSEDFARVAGEMNPAQRQAARVAARDAIEARGNTPAGAAGMLDDLSVGRGSGQRADGLLGDDAVRLRQNAEYARRELETGRNVSPRTGSQTNDNSMQSRLADGVATVAGVARDVATGNKVGLATRAADFLRQRGFNDAEAEALLMAGLDRSRTDELIGMFTQKGMTRREARSSARTLTHMLVRPTAETMAD